MLKKYEEPVTVYVNGKIITVDAEDSIVEAMLVSGERILATGTTAEILEAAPPRRTVVDLEGRAVIPGIVDSHCHMELTVSNLELGLIISCPREVRTLAGLLARIAARVKETEPGSWIIARGPNGMDKLLEEGRAPTTWELDRVSPDNPLALFYSAHYTVLNSRAIEETGWRMESELPFSATMGRDPATGKPTGIYTEIWNALDMIPWRDGEVKEALRRGTVKHFSRYGVTSVHELPYSMRGLRLYRELYEEGGLFLRIRYYLLHPEGLELDEMLALGMRRGMGDRWLAFGGLKLFADGACQRFSHGGPEMDPGRTE